MSLGADDRTTVMAFLGLWLDPSGRSLSIERRDPVVRDRSSFDVTVRVTGPDGHGEDFLARLHDGGLVVEAGVVGLGPTYRLTRTDDDRLVPEVGMGLYDDFEEDLGVPWAFPLEPYRRAPNGAER